MSKDLRVVLMGKTGAGKSSTGNTLLGRDAFRVGRGLRSGTEQCQWADEEREDVVLMVTDTPGVCDTHRDEKEVLKEVGKSVAVARPGPHVLLMVLRCDTRFTKEELQAYNTLKQLFGETIKAYVIIVFVGADAFGETLDKQREGVMREMVKATGHICEVLRDANDRYFAINNRASREDRERQARDLLAMMKKLTDENDGKYFSSQFSDEVSLLVEPLVEKKMQQLNLTRREADREAKNDIVGDNEVTDFVEKLVDVVSKKVVPLVKKVFRAAVIAMQLAKGAKRLKSDSEKAPEPCKSDKDSGEASLASKSDKESGEATMLRKTDKESEEASMTVESVSQCSVM